MSKNAVMPLDDYKNACDNIREKTETTDLITSGELSEKINEVYEAGQKAEHDKFWDVYQENGERKNYQNAFWGEGWNDETFKPKYDISLNATSKEYHNTQTFEYSKITDINKILNDCGVRIISSGVERLNGTFRYATITNLDLDVSSCVSMLMAFYAMDYLKSLSLRNLRADCAFNRVITFCYALENLSITGTIGTGSGGDSSINLRYSTKLTKESLMNIIGCLKDFREKIVDNYTYLYDWQNPTQILGTHTLVAGAEYNLYHSNWMYGVKSGTATAQMINVPNVGNVLGLQYDFSHPAGEGFVLTKYIYQSGDSVVLYEDENGGEFETIISFIKAPTETRSITFGTTNLNKLTDAEKAQATEKGWTLL